MLLCLLRCWLVLTRYLSIIMHVFVIFFIKPGFHYPIKIIEITERLCICQFQAPRSPRADPRGNFLKWSKTLPRGKIFLQKHGPRDKKIPTPGEYCERSNQLFLFVGVEILEFCRKQEMVHQFEAEKCLHAALTGNLVL